jgi:hypothetical protein
MTKKIEKFYSINENYLTKEDIEMKKSGKITVQSLKLK